MKLISLLCVLLIAPIAAHAMQCAVSAVSVRFDRYDPLNSTPLDSVGTVQIRCDARLPFTVALGPGVNPGSEYHQRVLSSALGETIRYNLFIDTARTQVWGDGTGATFVKSEIGTSDTQSFNIFGRIPPGQLVLSGLYTDAVQVRVDF